MDLMTKLKAIGSEVKALRESMTIVDPRNTNTDLTALESGDRQIRAPKGISHQRKVAEAAKLFADIYAGRRPAWHLREAMTTSDFPYLFGDVLHRQLLGNYMPYPVTYPKYFRVVTANDFRNLNLYTLDGGQGILTTVKERAPYPEIAFTEGRYQVAIAKYGRRYGISFEMVVNDDLNAFQQRPALMAVGARRSEEYLATTMMADASGPHATFFTAGHANIVTGNPILSIQGLQTAMAKLAAQTDADSQPIVIDVVNLVVPPALLLTAQNILNATQLRINSSAGNPSGAAPGGATLDQYLYTANWMTSKVILSVNPYLPYISTTNGNTSWYLIANPNDLTQRPAFVFAKLRGHETPELFVKESNQRMLGGGDSPILEGDFESDSIDYKLRAFMGAVQCDPKMAVSSNGTEVA